MRISDWSSDVCSSDLLCADCNLMCIDVLAPSAGLRRVLQERQERFKRRAWPHVLELHAIERPADVQILDRHDDQRLRAQLGLHGERGQNRHPDARSEEHTSELQSLMRISYAVFCLKKKN